jgi:hypothetical protein
MTAQSPSPHDLAPPAAARRGDTDAVRRKGARR